MEKLAYDQKPRIFLLFFGVYFLIHLLGQSFKFFDFVSIFFIVLVGAILWFYPKFKSLWLVLGVLAFVLLRRELIVLSVVPLVSCFFLVAFYFSFKKNRFLMRAACVGVSAWLFLAFGETYMWACEKGWVKSSWYYKEKWPDGVPFHSKDLNYLGFIPIPNIQARNESYFYGDELDWAVRYTINPWGHRLVTHQKSEEPAVALFGCSMTFGHGLEDHETLGSRLQGFISNKVVNCGVNAYGPTQVLLAMEGLDPWPRLESIGPIQEIIYFFIPHHLYRHTYSKEWSYRADPDEAVYYLTQDGLELDYRAQTSEIKNPPWLVFWNQHSRLNKITRSRFLSEPIESKWIELTAQLIQKMRDVARDRWQANFQVVFLASHDLDRYRESIGVLKSQLEQNKISVVDFMDLPGDLSSVDRVNTYFDLTTRHLTSLHAFQIAQELSKKINVDHKALPANPGHAAK